MDLQILYSAIIGWEKYWQKVYLKILVGKYLVNAILNKTTYTYIINLLFLMRLKRLIVRGYHVLL